MLYTLRTGATAHPEDSVLQFVTDLVAAGGVTDASGANFRVDAQTSPNMTVKVNSGNAYVKGSSGNGYPVRADASADVTINPNSSGNSRIDAVVLYIDKSQTANADASNVAKLISVQGTPAPSPTAPSDSDISTAIGSSNPFIRLAQVTVASGASSIVSGNITDKRSIFTLDPRLLRLLELANTPTTPASGYGLIYAKNDSKPRYLDDSGLEWLLGEEDWVPLTDGATITIDLSLGKKFKVTLGGNRSLVISNYKTGKAFAVKFVQDGTGSRLISTWFNIGTTFAPADVNVSTDIITVNRDIDTTTPITFTNSGGGLPGGLSAGTVYYTIRQSATTIKVSSSLANAQAGTAIDITSQGTGTHTVYTEIRWPGNSAPTLTTGKYRRDCFVFFIDTGYVIEGAVSSQDN